MLPRRPPASAPVTIACDAAYHLCDANDKRASHTRLASAIRRRIRGNAGALTRSRALFPRLSGPIPAAHRRRWRPPVGAAPAGLPAGVRAGQGVAKRENTARWGARSRLSSWVVDRRAAHAPAESTRWAEVRTFAASLRARFEVLGTRADSRAPQSRAGRLVADATSAHSPAQYGEARSYYKKKQKISSYHNFRPGGVYIPPQPHGRAPSRGSGAGRSASGPLLRCSFLTRS